MRALVLLLLPIAALAQHDHGVAIKVLPPGAEETGDHMGQHGLLSTTSGASSDGSAFLVPSVTGWHILHNGSQKGEKAPQRVYLEAGRPIYIMPHKGALIWTPPGGARGVVPNDNLIPIKKSYP